MSIATLSIVKMQINLNSRIHYMYDTSIFINSCEPAGHLLSITLSVHKPITFAYTTHGHYYPYT